MAAAGEWGWFRDDAREPKMRVGVVVGVADDGRLFVALGTGTERRPPWYILDHRCRLGLRLGLSKPTYFYPGMIRLLPASNQVRSHGLGPPEVFLDIQELLPHIPKRTEVVPVDERTSITIRRSSAVPPAPSTGAPPDDPKKP